jgi:hypothetical protein
MSENLHEKKTRVGFTNPAPVYVRFFIFPFQSQLHIIIYRHNAASVGERCRRPRKSDLEMENAEINL